MSETSSKGSPRYTLSTEGHVDDLAAGYALGALEPGEQATVERHIVHCSGCADLVDLERRTANMLSLVIPSATPGPDVKAALFARIAHVQRTDTPRAGVAIPSTLTIPASQPALSPGANSSAPLAGRRRLVPQSSYQLNRATALLTLPMVVALMLTGTWAMQLRSQVADRGDQVSELEATLANLGAEATLYDLLPGPDYPGADGDLLVGANGRSGVVQLDVDTGNPANLYRLLVVKDGKLIPAATIEVNEDGKGQARFALDQDLEDFQRVQIDPVPLDSDAFAAGGTSSVLQRSMDGSESIGAPDSAANDIGP